MFLILSNRREPYIWIKLHHWPDIHAVYQHMILFRNIEGIQIPKNNHSLVCPVCELLCIFVPSKVWTHNGTKQTRFIYSHKQCVVKMNSGCKLQIPCAIEHHDFGFLLVQFHFVFGGPLAYWQAWRTIMLVSFPGLIHILVMQVPRSDIHSPVLPPRLVPVLAKGDHLKLKCNQKMFSLNKEPFPGSILSRPCWGMCLLKIINILFYVNTAQETLVWVWPWKKTDKHTAHATKIQIIFLLYKWPFIIINKRNMSLTLI